jgi:hypothetical protein
VKALGKKITLIIFFLGKSCTDQVKLEVMNKLMVQSEMLNDLYLGILASKIRSPTATLYFLCDRI